MQLTAETPMQWGSTGFLARGWLITVLLTITPLMAEANWSIRGYFGRDEIPLKYPVPMDQTLKFKAEGTARQATSKQITPKQTTLISGYWRLSERDGATVSGSTLDWQIAAGETPPDYRFIPSGLAPGRYRVNLHYWYGAENKKRRQHFNFTLFADRWISSVHIGGEPVQRRSANQAPLRLHDAVDIPLSFFSYARPGIGQSRLLVSINNRAGQVIYRQQTEPHRHARFPKATGHKVRLNTTTLPLRQALNLTLLLSGNRGREQRMDIPLSIQPWKPKAAIKRQNGRQQLCLASPDGFSSPIETKLASDRGALDASGCMEIPSKLLSLPSIRIEQVDAKGRRASTSVSMK